MPEAIEAPVVDVEPVQNEITAIDATANEGVAADAALEQQSAVEDAKGDERTLPQWIRDLKSTDPKRFREEKNSWFGFRAFKDKTLGFDLDKTKQWLEEGGGMEGFQSSFADAQTKAQEYEALTESFRTGNPAVIDDLIASAPDGFAKLAPEVFAKWGAVDPQAWNSTMGGLFAATIAQSGVANLLDKMEMRLQYGDTQSLAAELTQLKQWAASFQERAGQSGQQQQRQQPNAAEQSAQQRLADMERSQFTTKYREEATSWREGEVRKELQTYFDRDKNNKDKQDITVASVVAKVKARMESDKDYLGKLGAFEAKRDSAGAMRLVKSREAEAIKDIAPGVGRSVFGNPAPKVEAKPEVAPKPRIAQTPSKRNDPFDAIWARGA